MSTKHLAAGSVEPPRTEGLVRLYSMRYCPYAHRILLVLKAKNIPHDVVNVSLYRKPEWFSKINPKTQVPTLVDGDKIVLESLDIADYLDEKYPENSLYPSDPVAKKWQKEVIEKAGAAEDVYSRCAYTKEEHTPEEWAKLFLETLQPLEKELASKGTTYFGGENPGMADFMIWPWGERAGLISLRIGQKVPFKDGDIPLLRKWTKSMLKHPVCAELHISAERYFEILQFKLYGGDPNYDEV